jgi:hypothetical protein
METKAKTQEILNQFGLDFRIEKLPMMGKLFVGNDLNGLPMYKEIISSDYGLYNTKSNEIINIVKEGYTVSQNDEVIELVLEGMRPFGDTLQVTKAGSLHGGRKTFVQLEIEGYSLVGTERIKRYVTVIDSNDGSTGLSIGIGELVLSCQNQFFKFYKNGQSKYRHTTSLTQRIKELPFLIENSLLESLSLTETYKTFQSNEISRNLAHKLVKDLLGYDKLMSVKQESELGTRSLNAMNELYNHIEKEMNQKGNNLFGLFSGVTSWSTHSKAAPKRENGRVESMMVGTNYRTNQQAFDWTNKQMLELA